MKRDKLQSFKSQLYGFVVKTFVQRWRSPFSTAAEVLLPFIFVLLLCIGYWTSSTTVTKSQVFDPSNEKLKLSAWSSVNYFFCAGPEGKLKLRLRPCIHSKDGDYTCMSNVADGKSLCLFNKFDLAVKGQSMAYTGLKARPIALGSLDTYLVLSAFVTNWAVGMEKTFFERSYLGSLSHYGKLLVASENDEVARLFMTYCRARSSMCTDVLHPDVFDSNESAMTYAVDNANTVWAILYLPHDLFTGGTRKEMSISMNYSATPKTFKAKAESFFTHKISEARSTDADFMLYYASGFAPLQNFVHSFYLAHLVKTTKLIGPGQYLSDATSKGISSFLGPSSGRTMPMPTPASTSNMFMDKWVYYMPMVAVISAIFPIARFTGLIVDEKAKGIREAMMIMGMRHSCLFAGWYVSAIAIDAVAALFVSTVLCLGCLHTTNWLIVFGVYFTFLQQNSAMCMLISAFFSNARLASWFAAFMSFLLIMPFYSIPTATQDISRLMMSLLPDVGYAQAFDIMAKYARTQTSVSFAVAAQGTLCINHIVGVMWLSTVVMMILAMYLDQVLPNATGVAKHPLFFLKPLLCGLCLSHASSLSADSHESCSSNPRNKHAQPLTLAANIRNGDDRRKSGSSHDRLPDCVSKLQERDATHFMENESAIIDPAHPDSAVVLSHVCKVYSLTTFANFVYTLFTGLLRPGSRVVALNGITLSMRRNEICVLLGPNGSGKTTMMNIIAGMTEPTSGKVYIHGMHRTRDPDNCQRCIGYCPQRNTVWNTLTVEEHLTFYARLKGSASVHISQVVANTMGQVNLTHKRHSYAGSLSGGELRRLCLGMALVGDSSVLLLDEPTAGMDMKGRQVMYEVLRRTRQGRSVLLCTHQLDGADRVADRVIMIQHGSLRAVGSPMYLKSRMPTGYVVTCILNPSLVSPAEQQRATNELLDYIRAKAHSNQLVMTDVVQEVPLQCHLFAMQRRGREVVLRLPFSTGTDLNNTFFRSLVADKAMLKLHSIGLQVTSLESVYTTVMADEENANSLLLSSMSAAGDGSRADPSAAVGANGVIAVGKEDPRSTGESALMENEHGGENNSNENSMCTKNSQNISAAEGQLIHGAEHDTHIVYTKHNFAVTFVRHMRALFLKRWHFAKRDCKTITFQIVFPVFFLLLALLINLTRAPTQPSLLMDMSMYMDYQTNPSEVVVATSPPYEAAFALNATSPASILGDHYTYSWIHGAAIPADLSTPVSAQLLKEINTHASPRYVGLVPSVNVTNMSLTYTVLHNTSFPHTLPQGIDVMYHTAQSQLFGTAVPKLVTRNTPMRMSAYEVQLYGTSKPVIQGMFIIVPFVLLPAHMISYIVHEHECGARHLQWMSGVSVLAYWLSSFLFDAVCYVFTVALTFAMFFLFGMREYTSNDTFAASVVMFLLFGLASIPFNYVLSFFFRSPSAAQNFVLFINFSGGFLWPTMQSFLITGLPNFVPLMAKILRCLPATSFGESIFIISGNSMAKMLVMMGYHMNIWAWVNSGGVFTSLTYMLCTLAVSVFLLIVFEYVKLNKLLRLFSSQILSEHKPNGTDNVGANSPNPITSKRPCTDTSNYIYAENGSVALRNEVPPDYIHVNSSVALEEQRVCDCSCGYPREDGIVMQHITKQYFGTNAAALRDFSLGVHKGEVMALLGLNGAGKSTAMGILAGKIVANTGKAFMNHKNVLNVAARVETGYCPQTNPLLHMLTAQEHLWLYARLRGAVECTIAHEVNSLLRELGLFAHRHTPACRLSGGNQRRLCLAVSLVGNTSVVLLDEPTAGMDVLARLQTCKMIQRLAAKKSVLLTTHLMDEVEALANRVAFLVNGRLSSVGTPHDLKMSYMGGMSHMVTILFPCSEVDLQDAEQQGVVRAVKAHMDDLIQQSNCTNRNEEDEMRKEGSKQCGMSECVVQDVRFSSMTLMTSMPLSSILTFVSDLYAGRVPNVPCVSNVSISQPTLEDVLSRQ